MDILKVLLLIGLILGVVTQQEHGESGSARVMECPATESDWKLKSSQTSCFKNKTYHCIMTEEGDLLEICLKPKLIHKERNGCPRIGTVDGLWEFAPHSKCPRTTAGCPDNKNSYMSDQLYKFPACTHAQSNSTVQSIATIDQVDIGLIVGVTLGILVPLVVVVGILCYLYRRKKICQRKYKVKTENIEICRTDNCEALLEREETGVKDNVVETFTSPVIATYHSHKKWILRCKVSNDSTECRWFKEVSEGEVVKRRISLENDRRFIVRKDLKFRILEVLDASDFSGLYLCELSNGKCCHLKLDTEETNIKTVEIGGHCEFKRPKDETNAKCEWFKGETLIAMDAGFTQHETDGEFILLIDQVQEEDQGVSYRSKIGDEMQFYTLVLSEETALKDSFDGLTPQGLNDRHQVVQQNVTDRGEEDAVLHVVREQAENIKILLDKIFNEDDWSKYKSCTNEIVTVLENICVHASTEPDQRHWFKSLVRTTTEKCKETIHGVKLMLMSLRFAFNSFCSNTDLRGKVDNTRCLNSLDEHLQISKDKVKESISKIVETKQYLTNQRKSLEDSDTEERDGKEKCKTLLDKAISSMGLLHLQWQNSDQQIKELQIAITHLLPLTKDASGAQYQTVASTVDQIRNAATRFYQTSGNFELYYSSVDERLDHFLRQCYMVSSADREPEDHSDNPADYGAVASQGRCEIYSNDK